MITLILTLAACSSDEGVNEFDYSVTAYQNATINDATVDDNEAVIIIVVGRFSVLITVQVTVIDLHSRYY